VGKASSKTSAGRARWRRGRIWLLTAAFIVMPLAGVLLVVYGVGRLVLRRRTKSRDPYHEWLRIRDLMRSRRSKAESRDTDTLRRRP
jgi:hypothetical protein